MTRLSVALMAGKGETEAELPTAFEKGRWSEEDEFACDSEEEDESVWSGRREEAREQGMIQVHANGWKEEVNQKIKEITGKECGEEALAEIEKASKATCVVRRMKDSAERVQYYKDLAEMSDGKEKKCNREAKSSDGGVGTGLLLYHRHINVGYIVITNNHVIMNKEEAMDAKVTFDYHRDGEKEGMTKVEVHDFIAYSPRTTSVDDTVNLDFSFLVLNDEDADVKDFLRYRGAMCEETVRIQATAEKVILDQVGLKACPLIMFSHPRNLAMRISIGAFPEEIKGYPVSHIKHYLPSSKGSSGANLLVASPVDTTFTTWDAAFLHYRHGCAVAWQVIGPKLRKQLED